MPLSRSWILPGVSFFLPQELPLTFIGRWICLWWILSACLYLEKNQTSIFRLCFWKTSHSVETFRLMGFSLHACSSVSLLTLLLTRNLLLPLSLLSCTWHLFLSALKMFSVSLKMKVKAAQPCLTLCDPHGLYSPWDSPGQNTGVGSLFLLQGIFLTQELNQGLSHCRQFFTGWATREVSVSLVLTYLIIMCFGIIFSMFLMLGIHWASWICGFILFISFGENSLIVSSNISPLFPLFLCFWGFHLHIYHTCVSYIQEPILVSHLTKQTCTWLLADESVGRGGLDPSAINMFHCSLLNGGNALLRQGSAPPVRSTMVATHPPVAMELWTVASRLSVKLHIRSWSLTPKIGMQNALLIML